MKRLKSYKKGVTLPEVLTVIVIVVMVTLVSMPAVDVFFDSMASQGSAEAMINAALSSARAMATSEHRYVGIRFQKRCVFLPDYIPYGWNDSELYNADNYDPLGSDQYMIFIIWEEPSKMSGLTIGFKALDGIKPIKLPENIGVMDLMYRTNANPDPSNDVIINDDSELTKRNLNDATTFSIVFSPSGKLVTHKVRTRNRDGVVSPENLTESDDDIFNSPYNIVRYKTGMFVQDDYVDPEIMSFGNELSRRVFIIYDRKELKRAFNNFQPVTGYLGGLTRFYINPYTGTIISQGR